MTKSLNEEQKSEIIKLIKEGGKLPSKYKEAFFPPEQKEYELIYDGKEREEDMLSDTMAVPLQPVKTFGKSEDGWTNKLIFGDNLQALKALMSDPEVKGKVKLIYIDPPFATKQDFKGSQDQKAYQDKIAGAKFLEFLRRRLIFLREILNDEGSIYVHLDYRKGHYCKVLLDEIFQETNFRNEIVWCYTGPSQSDNYFPRKHEYIYFYSKTKSSVFNPQYIPHRSGLHNTGQVFGSMDEGDEGDNEYVRELEEKGKKVEDWWVDIWATERYRSELLNYPTQKPEALLDRIIKASSNEGDIVLDCFCGSGTTLAVAEKLGRKWIGVDCGKLAIYTTQKRMLNLKIEIGNKRKNLISKLFTLYNAGLYDYKMIKNLSWDQYRDFALKLFQCRDEKHEISGLDIDGYYGSYHVLVFNFKKAKDKDIVLDRGYIDDLHKIIGKKISKRFFIVVPAANVNFFETIIEKDDIKYYVLTIPYSIINELHEKNFTSITQPVSEMDVNDTVDAVGFDFVVSPEIECSYSMKKSSAKDMFKNAGIKIKKFKSNPISKEPNKDYGLDTLSMVMIDYDYDGEIFDLDEVFYAENIKTDGYEVQFDVSKIKDKCMIIYIDIFGNEKREIKQVKDFK